MYPTELLLETPRFDVVRRTYQTGDGGIHSREVVRHPGAVTILPLLGNDRVCLIRNFRISVDQTLIELPAGTLESGEDPAAAALRELEEETGYTAGSITRLHEFYMSPGILSERMLLFLATELEPGPPRLEGGEQIETFVVSWAEAMALAGAGQIQDAKSIVGLLWYDRFRRPARNE